MNEYDDTKLHALHW